MERLMLTIFLIILNAALWAFLRRWYGGGFKNTWLGNHRGIQTTLMIVAMLPFFVFDFSSWKSWCIGLALTLWVQFQFWSRGHGPAFDVGHDTDPSDSIIKRYQERWYDKVCKFWFPEEFWYTRPYDALWMFLRYTCPMLVPAFISPLYLLPGFCAPVVYDRVWEKYGNWYLAEYIIGGVFGLVIAIVRVYAV